jgi:hypothetical protein
MTFWMRRHEMQNFDWETWWKGPLERPRKRDELIINI